MNPEEKPLLGGTPEPQKSEANIPFENRAGSTGSAPRFSRHQSSTDHDPFPRHDGGVARSQPGVASLVVNPLRTLNLPGGGGVPGHAGAGGQHPSTSYPTSRIASSLSKAPELESSLSSSRFIAKTRLDRVRPSLQIDAGASQTKWTGRLSVYCTCNTFSMKELFQRLVSIDGWTVRRFSREVLHAKISIANLPPSAPGDYSDLFSSGHVEDLNSCSAEIFFFDYGVIVTWGISESSEWQILKIVAPFENGKLEEESEHEVFDYSYFDHLAATSTATPHPFLSIERDTFLLSPDMNAEELLRVKLACSLAVAQNEKLASFESAVEGIFKRIEHYPIQLAQSGVLPLSDRELLKMSGELYTYSAYINLQTDILDVPDVLWDFAEVEHIYERVHKYLDVTARVSILNKRLGVIESMYSLFRDERHISYEHRLELIIIYLIIIEIVLDLLELYLMFIGA